MNSKEKYIGPKRMDSINALDETHAQSTPKLKECHKIRLSVSSLTYITHFVKLKRNSCYFLWYK